jgi:ribosome modulation factor
MGTKPKDYRGATLKGIPMRGIEAFRRGFAREACPFVYDWEAKDRSEWLGQWNLCAHFEPKPKQFSQKETTP